MFEFLEDCEKDFLFRSSYEIRNSLIGYARDVTSFNDQ